MRHIWWLLLVALVAAASVTAGVTWPRSAAHSNNGCRGQGWGAVQPKVGPGRPPVCGQP
jgi:hypothetical protein